MPNMVCIREFEALGEAEAARMMLGGAGIDAWVQGSESGHILGGLVPARFPLMVDVQHADSARELLQAQADVVAEADEEPLEVSKAKRWGFVRSVFAFHVFALITGGMFALVSTLGVGMADAVHATPYGHVVRAPIPFLYVAGGLSLLLTLSRRLRARAILLIPLVALALVATSLHARETPRSEPPTVRFLR